MTPVRCQVSLYAGRCSSVTEKVIRLPDGRGVIACCDMCSAMYLWANWDPSPDEASVVAVREVLES